MKLLNMNGETIRRVPQLMRKCPECHGNGKLLVSTQYVTYTVACDICGGKGSVIDSSFGGRATFETKEGIVIS